MFIEIESDHQVFRLMVFTNYSLHLVCCSGFVIQSNKTKKLFVKLFIADLGIIRNYLEYFRLLLVVDGRIFGCLGRVINFPLSVLYL